MAETTTVETTTRSPWTVNAEEARALSTPSTSETTTDVATDPLLQAQQQLREFATNKKAEGYALTQIAQDINSAIANPQFKLTERDAIKQQVEIALTRNYFQVKAAKSALESDVLSAATNAFDVAGKAYLTSAEISGTQEKQSFDVKEEIRRDANIMRHQFEGQNAQLSAEKAEYKYKARAHKWNGGTAPWVTVNVETVSE